MPTPDSKDSLKTMHQLAHQSVVVMPLQTPSTRLANAVSPDPTPMSSSTLISHAQTTPQSLNANVPQVEPTHAIALQEDKELSSETSQLTLNPGANA